jgi:hypothetical protein
MTHDGPGDDCWSDRAIRDGERRRKFERSIDYPDPEHSTYTDVEIAFQAWKRKHWMDD